MPSCLLRMKTVSAHIISSKPVSLSRAAKFLSNFVEYDNGASHAISTYLQRTSDAFNELSDFHKKLKSPGPNRKSNSSKTSFGISTSYNEPSTVSACSSEGEKVTEKRKEKNRKKEVDGDLSLSICGIGVDGSKSVMRHAHGEASGNDFEGNLANGVVDNCEAVTEKKKRKEKHKWKDQVDESAENGGEAQERDGESNIRYSVSNGSEGIGADLSEKSGEKKRKKKKKKKREEGDRGLPPNNASTEEKEISDGKLGSEEGKKENSKKRKNVDAPTSIEADGSDEHSKKKTKRKVGADQDL